MAFSLALSRRHRADSQSPCRHAVRRAAQVLLIAGALLGAGGLGAAALGASAFTAGRVWAFALAGAAGPLFGRRCLSFTIDRPSSVETLPAKPENKRLPYHPSPTWQSAFRLR